MEKIGLGGGCHWCTEAVFLSLKGVLKVEQGWIASAEGNDAFSEAVIVHFNRAEISIDTLIAVHLHTHSSSSYHALRNKYRSAVYVFDEEQKTASVAVINKLQDSFNHAIITQVLPFKAFRPSEEAFRNYYYKNTQKPFCTTHIDPKLAILLKQFSSYANTDKINTHSEMPQIG